MYTYTAIIKHRDIMSRLHFSNKSIAYKHKIYLMKEEYSIE